MADISVSELLPSAQKLAVQARNAQRQGNWDYVLEVSDQLLRIEPGCIAVRKLNREAQLQKNGRKSSWWKKLKGGVSQVKPAAGDGDIAKIDAVLQADPCSRTGWRKLAAIAHIKHWPETQLFALQELCSIAPENLTHVTALTDLYLTRGMHGDAGGLVDQFVKSRPRDPAAIELHRKVTVAQTLQKGNWESDGTFRDKLRD